MWAHADAMPKNAPDGPTTPRGSSGRRIQPLPLRGSRPSYAPGPGHDGRPPSPLTDPVPSAGLISPFRLPAEIEAGWGGRPALGRSRP